LVLPIPACFFTEAFSTHTPHPHQSRPPITPPFSRFLLCATLSPLIPFHQHFLPLGQSSRVDRTPVAVTPLHSAVARSGGRGPWSEQGRWHSSPRQACGVDVLLHCVFQPASHRLSTGSSGWPASMCGGKRTRVAAGSPRTATASALRLGAAETELPATRLGGRRRAVEAADRPSPPPPRTGEAEAAAAPEKCAKLDPPPPSSCLRASSEIFAMPPPAVLRCPLHLYHRCAALLCRRALPPPSPSDGLRAPATGDCPPPGRCEAAGE
jgi:hypothetical protein